MFYLQIRKKFVITIEKDVMPKINKTSLILTIAEKINAKLSKVKPWDFDNPDPFTLDDLVSISSKVSLFSHIFSILSTSISFIR